MALAMRLDKYLSHMGYGTRKEVKEIIKALVDHTNDVGTLQMIIEELLETQGDYEDLGQCEECGDWVTKYTLEI